MSILVEGNVQAPRPKRSPKVIVIVCLVALLLALGSGGIFFLLKSRGHSISILASAGTPTPTPTRISTVTPPAQAAFFDTFVNNHLGWDLSNGAGYIRALANGMLLLTDTNPGTTLVESLPNNGIYNDFKLTVNFSIVKADKNDSAGVYVRGDNNLDHDYRIDINGDNTFDVAKEQLDAHNNLLVSILDGPRSNSTLKPLGQQNVLTVIMNGTRLVLLINGTEVSSITDSDYSTGQIALFTRTGEGSNGITMAISRVEVDLPPGKHPG
jgi:hypothetical protein